MVIIINTHKKLDIYGGNVNRNFQGKKILKEKAPCKCLPIIRLYSVVKAKKKYYPQKPLEVKMEDLIYDDLEKISSGKSDSKSDNDSND